MRFLTWFVAVFAAGAACAPQERHVVSAGESGPPGAGSLIELRLAHTEQRPDRMPVEYGGRLLYLDTSPVVSDSDFVQVRPYVRDSAVILSVSLDSASAERLRRTTAAHLGTAMAIVYNSRIVSAPVIQAEIGSTTAMEIRVPASDPAATLERVLRQWPTP